METDNVSTTSETQLRQDVEEHITEKDLEFHARTLNSLIIPVSITMILVIFVVRSINIRDTYGGTFRFLMVYIDGAGDPNAFLAYFSFINAGAFIVLMVVVTIIFVCLYKHGCMKVIWGWLGTATTLLLGFFGGLIIYMLLDRYAVPIDYISFALIVYNFAIVGVIAVFVVSPMRIQQMYLVVVSVFMAWALTQLPEPVTWFLLCAIAIYDIFAVLCPRGPLKQLVEIAQARNEPIPGLIYTAQVDDDIESQGTSAQQGPEGEPTVAQGHAADAPKKRKLLWRRTTPSAQNSTSTYTSTPTPTPTPTQQEMAPTQGYQSAGTSELSNADMPSDAPASPAIQHLNSDAGGNHEGSPACAARFGAGEPAQLDEDVEITPAAFGTTLSHTLPPPCSSLPDSHAHPLPHNDPPGQITQNDQPGQNIVGNPQGEPDGQPSEEVESASDGTVRLGLGDFIFYSVLIARAALADYTTVVACFFAILAGLTGTVLILAFARRALPALPLSIFMGAALYFITKYLLTPFLYNMLILLQAF